MDITIDLLNYKQASLRACNRLADPIANLLGFTINHSDSFGNTRIQYFPCQCLLPVLNVLAYYEPLAWHEVKTGASYSAVYELASHGKLFVELLDEAIEEAWGTSKDELPYHQEIKSRRSRFVEDVCAAIYTDSYTDSRIRELSNINLKHLVALQRAVPAPGPTIDSLIKSFQTNATLRSSIKRAGKHPSPSNPAKGTLFLMGMPTQARRQQFVNLPWLK